MARKSNNNNNLKIYMSTGATAINDSVCESLTDSYTDGKKIAYVSASLRTAHIFNKIGKALYAYDESECKLGSVTVTHVDKGFTVKKLVPLFSDADVLVIDDMSATVGYPFGLVDEFDALKKFASDGKRVIAGVVMSRKKGDAAGLLSFVEGYAKKNGVQFEEIKRDDDGDEDAPEPESEPKKPENDEHKEGE